MRPARRSTEREGGSASQANVGRLGALRDGGWRARTGSAELRLASHDVREGGPLASTRRAAVGDKTSILWDLHGTKHTADRGKA
jgi:hypothetical protein